MPAQLDFQAIAEGVDVEAVASELGITLSPEGRAGCPACQSEDRALEILAETNSFRCWAADPPAGKQCLAGDCIGLYAHIKGYTGMYRAAKELSELFRIGGTVKERSNGKSNSIAKHVPAVGTAPPARQKATTTREPTRAEFDPSAFLAKLEYTEEVAATGLSEEDAQSLGVGFHRGKLYQAVRWPNGDIAAFTHPDGNSLKFPRTLVRPREARIVSIPKRA